MDPLCNPAELPLIMVCDRSLPKIIETSNGIDMLYNVLGMSPETNLIMLLMLFEVLDSCTCTATVKLTCSF